MDILFWLFLIALLALGAAAAVWVAKGYFGGQSAGASIFGQRAERRLAVIEHTNVDSRRKLVLIRRDGIEHLIMTGGPVDVVIETGIGEARRRGDQEPAAQPTFSRPSRPFGQTSERAAE